MGQFFKKAKRRRIGKDCSVEAGHSQEPLKKNPHAAESKIPDNSGGLMKLFYNSVKALFCAENHLLDTIPNMIRSAQSSHLKDALADHRMQTKVHAERLQQVFEQLGQKPVLQRNEAMEELISEGEAVIESTDADTPARDLGIIMAAQKLEHYEIASYSGVTGLAERLHLSVISTLLSKSLKEDIEADNTLASIAIKEIDSGISDVL